MNRDKELPLALTERWTLPHPQWPQATWDLVLRHCSGEEWVQDLPDECIDLVYIDPPFATGREWKMQWDGGVTTSFADPVGDIEDYTQWLAQILAQVHRVLKPTGSLCVHLDWHAVHYVKVALDGIFGYSNFKNEIIWAYRTAGNSKRHFARKHDTILLYAKDVKEAKFNVLKQRSYLKKRYGYGAHYQEHFDPERQQYYTEVLMRDVWTDIPALKGCNRERVGYPTQKPLKLLERLILATTDPDDVVADFFCGSGTTLEAAVRHGRRFLGCDISQEAVTIARERLLRARKALAQMQLFEGEL
ncbi:MAG: site-specific DNA-methyltransferase [Firmicutes bacterium]|nr:site-specific DNA-methyltransferase [Bacillota bacterium]